MPSLDYISHHCDLDLEDRKPVFFLHTTLQHMTMHQHATSGYKRLHSSEDIIWTKPWHPDSGTTGQPSAHATATFSMLPHNQIQLIHQQPSNPKPPLVLQFSCLTTHHIFTITPSVPQPVKFLGWKMDGHSHKQYIFWSYSASPLNAMHFDENLFTCQCEKEKKRA